MLIRWLIVAPDNIPLPSTIYNPAVPPSLLPMLDSSVPLVAYNQRRTGTPKTQIIGTGPERKFGSVSDVGEAQLGYPPRPVPGAILDLDLVNERCDFGTNKVNLTRPKTYRMLTLHSMSATAWNFSESVPT